MLHLTGKGSIWDAISGAAHTVANAAISGVRDVGDLGSYAAGAITDNQQAQQNALNAIRSNDQNLSTRPIGQNAAALGQDLVQNVFNPIARPAAQLAVGLGVDANNALHGTNLTAQQLQGNSLVPWLIDYGTNHGQVKNPGGIRELLGSGIETGVNAATLGKGKAIEQAAEQGIRNVVGNGLGGRVASRVLGSTAVGTGAGVGYGTGQAVQDAQNVGDVVRDIYKGGETGGIGGALVGGVTAAPDVVRTARDNAIPLNEAGSINGPAISPEDEIHKNNPLNPPVPTEPTVPEPTASDLVAASRAAEQIDQAPTPIDFNQVEGAGQKLAQAVQARADSLQQMEGGLKGGQKQPTFDEKGNITGYVRTTEHTPFYSKVYAETGRKPTKAMWREEAERQLRSGTDEESQNYQHLSRHAGAEQELKQYEAANRQSGYNKVRLKNAPAGTPKSIPSYVREKISSPEYAAKNQSGGLLQRVRDELGPARAEVKALDQQIKKLSAKGDLNGIRDLNERGVSARLKLRALEGLERAQSTEYGRLVRQLDEKFPDTELRLKGKQRKAYVSGTPVRGADKVVSVQGQRLTQSQLEEAVMEGAIDPQKALQTYASPEARKYLENEVAKAARTTPSATVKTANATSGEYNPEEDGYSPQHDHTLPQETPEPAPRNLAGDEAAFQALTNGGTLDDAVKAYQEATGASEAVADEAVGRVADTADVGTNEDVLKRNPQYDKTKDFAPQNLDEVGIKARGYGKVLDNKVTRLEKAAKDLSEHDVNLLDDLRGNPIKKVAARAEDPKAFTAVGKLAKDISDYSHEIRRLNGDSTIYRENYGAGMHYADFTPKEQAAVSGYRDTLASQPGFSKERLIGDYKEASSKYKLTRKNANFIEDVSNDTRKTLYYLRDRAIYRGIQEVKGADSVNYGEPKAATSKQLNGTRSVYGTPEVAAEWDKLNPQKHAKTGVVKIASKTYDKSTSGVTQLIMVNNLIHGSNLLYQAYTAAGKVDLGGTGFIKNVTRSTDSLDAKYGDERFEVGGHKATYDGDKPGLVSRVTGGQLKGLAELNKRGIAAEDYHLRLATYATLREGGLSPREAVIQEEKFMGNAKAIGEAAHNFTIFWKFFTTMTGALKEQASHPVEQGGTILNAAIGAGVVYGLDKALQAWLGNKHAKIHTPGELGILNDIYKSGQDLLHHHYVRAGGIVLNRVNPLAKQAVEQTTNRDLYTGKNLDEEGRLKHAENITPESQGYSKVSGDAKNAAEVVANLLGVSTPHAKTAPAAPSGRANFLNQSTVQSNGQTVKVKSAPGKDPTGIDQQTAFFDSLEKAKATLPAARQKVYDQITAGETDVNGQPVAMNDKQAQAHYADMYANPDILKAIVKQRQDYAKKTGLPLDPLYSPKVTDDQRAEYAHLQSLAYKGDDYIQQANANASWLKPLEQARIAYQSKQDYSGSLPSQRVLPPKFDEQTQQALDAANSLSGKDKADYIVAHPELQAAYNAIAKYTNDRRVAEGNTAFKLFPQATPQVDAIIKEYNALPLGGGSRGGNKFRALWIQANPDKYAQMQSYYAQSAEWELANSAGQDRFVGNTPSQEELKSAYDLGKYDIAVNKDANGNKVYSINPSSASEQSSGSGGSSFTSGGSFGTTSQFKINRAARNYYNEQNRQHIPRIKTISQNRRFLGRPVRTRYLHTKKVAKTGKLRIKSATIS